MSIEKKVVVMGPQEDLQEVRSVFLTGGIAQYAAGVEVAIPAGFNVLLRIDCSQNFNDLAVASNGSRTPIIRCLYRIGTPYTCFLTFAEGEQKQFLTVTGTPAGACDMNLFIGKFKPSASGDCP
jgi:hypothetical protein